MERYEGIDLIKLYYSQSINWLLLINGIDHYPHLSQEWFLLSYEKIKLKNVRTRHIN